MKITKNTLFRDFLRYVCFNILSMVGVSCYILVDTYFIGNGIGANGLTALNLAIPLFGIQQAMSFMFSVGCGTKYSILMAQNRQEEANRLFTNTIVAAAVIGILFAAVIHIFSEPIVIAMGAKGELIPFTAVYTKTVLTFTPFFILNSILNLMVKNDLNPRLAMVAMLSGCLGNIILDYVFIYIADLSMFGAALATGASPIVDMAILSIHKIKKKNRFHLVRIGFSMKQFFTVVKLGMTSAVTELASGIVVMVFNWAILSISGNIGVAAYGVIANLAIVVLAIFNGIAQGMQPIISYNYGSGDVKNTKKVLRYGCVATLVAAIVMYGILWIYASPIVELFNGEHLEELHNIAVLGVRLYFSGIFFAGFSIVIAMYFNSIEDVRKAFIIAVLRGGIVMIPILLVLTMVFNLGMKGVWLSFTVSEAIIFFITLFMYKKRGKTPNS